MKCVLYSTRDGYALNEDYINELMSSPLPWYRKDEIVKTFSGESVLSDVVHVELQTMEDFEKLAKYFGRLIYFVGMLNGMPVIEIYDDYRE